MRRTATGLGAIAGVIMALFTAGCGETPLPTPSNPHDEHTGANGWLVFHIHDSSDIRIPGERRGDHFSLSNGAETLALRRLDPLCHEVPIFSGTICWNGDDSGVWTDVLRTGDVPYQVPCSWLASGDGAEEQHPRPLAPVDTSTWRLTFGTESPWYGDLVLRVDASGKAEGTIETATGDFRYLHGEVDDQKWVLQTFDGAHLFKFTGLFEGDSITNGWFASGHHYGTPLRGTRRSSSHPPLSEGQQAQWTGAPISFKGKSLIADDIDWVWDEHRDSVHVLSIMGSWCPNCLDEHRLLHEMLAVFPEARVHTLAFERGLDQENGEKRALRRLKKYAEEMELWRYDDRWDIALVGPASKSEARNLLPFLDQVVSFPTTIVLHPNAESPWIHSGFNGPATGAKYDMERSALAAAISGRLGNH